MKNGIQLFRERTGLSQSELARRIGSSRQQVSKLEASQRKLSLEWASKIAPHVGATPQELIFPEMARVNYDRLLSVHSIIDDKESEPPLALHVDLLEQLLPRAMRHRLRMLTVEDNLLQPWAERGDMLIVDLDEHHPAKLGIYLIDVNGTMTLKVLAPATTGLVTVKSGNKGMADEVLKPEKLDIHGRARLKLSRL